MNTTLSNSRLRQWPPAPGGAAVPSIDLRGVLGSTARLADKRLLLAGVGAVGGKVLEHAARLGIGELFVVDPDSYDSQSFFTQPCDFAAAERAKVDVQGERAHAIHPGITIHAAQTMAQDVPFRVLKQADVWVSAGDNRELPVSLGVLAAGLGKTLIQGAVDPETWTAYVRVYDLRDPEQSCPACGLSDAEWSQLRQRYGCGSLQTDLGHGEPTRTLPNVCSLAADLVTGEILKRLLELEPGPCSGEEIAVCLLTHRLWRTRMPRNPRCRCPHDRWTLRDVAADPRHMTLRSLQHELGLETRGPLRVRGEMPWVSVTICTLCGRTTPCRLFGRVGDVVGECDCGATLTASPLGLRSVVPHDDLATCRDTPLSQLGVAPGTALGFSEGEHWTYAFVGDGAER
jgi:hypothetical protein